MESVSLKLEPNFLRDIERTIRKNRYSTKTEFIRSAIRGKIKELEKKEAIERVMRLYGASKRKTTDEQLHEAGEKAFQEIAKEMGVKLD